MRSVWRRDDDGLDPGIFEKRIHIREMHGASTRRKPLASGVVHIRDCRERRPTRRNGFRMEAGDLACADDADVDRHRG